MSPDEAIAAEPARDDAGSPPAGTTPRSADPRLPTGSASASTGGPGGDRFDTAAFFTEHDLDELLDGTEPLDHLGVLAIEDLTDEEAAAFLAALRD